MIFYTGTHKVNHAKDLDRAFLSVSILRNRRSDFVAHDWIMDSGAFTEVSTYGRYRNDPDEYAQQIERWKTCGNLQIAVCQDYMCEPWIIEKTGLTVSDHQRLTIERYDALLTMTTVSIMPVLQGYQVEEYLAHLNMYGERLADGAWVGVGSICKRNSRPVVIRRILGAIAHQRPDLRLHGFGLKLTALADAKVTDLLYSADSMAWSWAARYEGRDANAVSEAIAYTERVLAIAGTKPSQLEIGLSELGI